MKKLFLGLIATVMFGFAGNAQNGSFSKSSMTVIVAATKDTYTKGMSYKEWLGKQIGTTAIPTKEEDKFLSDLYNYVSTNANSETVLKTYDGKSLYDLALLNSKNGLKAIKEGTFASQSRICWWCIVKFFIDLICQYTPCGGPLFSEDLP